MAYMSSEERKNTPYDNSSMNDFATFSWIYLQPLTITQTHMILNATGEIVFKKSTTPKTALN